MLKAVGTSLKCQPQCAGAGPCGWMEHRISCLLPAPVFFFSLFPFFFPQKSPDFLTPSLFQLCFSFTLLLWGSSSV